MSEGKPWYWNRRAFKRSPSMMDRVRRIDANLKKFYDDGRKDWPDRSYTFDRVDLGRVTWGRFEPLDLYNRFHMTKDRGDVVFAVAREDQGFIIPASTLAVPQFPHDLIPPYMATITSSDLDDRITGCEDFGGGQCETSVYFAEGSVSGLIKIGLATDTRTRLSSLRTSSQEPIHILAEFSANRLFEGFLHGLFEPLKHHGEWFYPHWSIYNVAYGATM